jgi:hypothetical protein
LTRPSTSSTLCRQKLVQNGVATEPTVDELEAILWRLISEGEWKTPSEVRAIKLEQLNEG